MNSTLWALFNTPAAVEIDAYVDSNGSLHEVGDWRGSDPLVQTGDSSA